jgi:hypothetical protein
VLELVARRGSAQAQLRTFTSTFIQGWIKSLDGTPRDGTVPAADPRFKGTGRWPALSITQTTSRSTINESVGSG